MEMVRDANEFLDIEQDAVKAVHAAEERVARHGVPQKPLTPERQAEVDEILKLSIKVARLPPNQQHAAQLRMLEELESRPKPGGVES